MLSDVMYYVTCEFSVVYRMVLRAWLSCMHDVLSLFNVICYMTTWFLCTLLTLVCLLTLSLHDVVICVLCFVTFFCTYGGGLRSYC